MDEASNPVPPAKRRILIVDANPLLRRGLAALIDGEADLAVCAEAATSEMALSLIATERPDLVVADFSYAPGLGLDLVRNICKRAGAPPIILMSVDNGALFDNRARQAGAVACVSKRELNGAGLAAIRAALPPMSSRDRHK